MKSFRGKKGKARGVLPTTSDQPSLSQTTSGQPSSSQTTSAQPSSSISDSLTLWCLVKGKNTPFEVKIDANANVGTLKKLIKAEKENDLRPYDADTLILFKLNKSERIKPDSGLASRIKKNFDTLGFQNCVTELSAADTVSENFSDQPDPKDLHIYVQLPADTTELEKRKRPSDHVDDISELQDNQAKKYRAGENPSHCCSSAKAMQLQQAKAEILNGRPWTSSGPPVGLYHPIFDQFSLSFKEDPKYETASGAESDSLLSIDDAFRFMRYSSEFYSTESSGVPDDLSGRTEAILPVFERLLGISLHRIKNADRTEPDFTAVAKTRAGQDARLLVAEIKLESGIGGDGKTQVQQSYARTCSLPVYEPVRLSCCSPCFLIEIAGPWITVLGAVFVHKVIVQHLAGPIYLPPQLLHPQSTIDRPLQLFSALRQAFKKLRGYYEELPRQTSFSRLFPYIQSYKLPNSDDSTQFEYKRLLSMDDSKAVYLAEDSIHGQVVVKFCSSYSVRAHSLLAEHQLAPPLIYDGTTDIRYGGLIMIVMGYVNGRTLNQHLYEQTSSVDFTSIIESVTRAITLLHNDDLVFGDLRTPNILVDESGKMKLIDYDWCGIHKKDKYPFIIGDGIGWAEGVGSYALLHKDHDKHMLKTLKDNIQMKVEPGSW